MIWLLLLFLAALVIAGVAWLFLPRLGAGKPAPKEADLLAEREEEEFDASVRRKQQERALQPVESPNASPSPDPQAEIIWDEHEDVYRPAPGDARRFAQSFNLERAPAFKPQRPLIFLRRPAYEKIQAHLRSDLTIELGGLLLGQAFHDPTLDAHFLLIEEALAAEGGEGTALSFEYTSTTWAHLTPQLKQMPPDWTVLGSYHSHPGLGIFLSATDRETQESIFSHDWQIALVMDPKTDQLGFFLGEKGKSCPDWFLVEPP